MSSIVITNNPRIHKEYGEIVQYLEGKDYVDVLKVARDYLHKNYQLLTHPLASNFLADKTIYKSIIVTKGDFLDEKGNSLLSDAIVLAEDSLKRRDNKILREDILEDLSYVDFHIMEFSISKIRKDEH